MSESFFSPSYEQFLAIKYSYGNDFHRYVVSALICVHINGVDFKIREVIFVNDNRVFGAEFINVFCVLRKITSDGIFFFVGEILLYVLCVIFDDELVLL